MIEAKNLSFSYPFSSPVFEEVDFKLAPKEVVVITGPTGSGKSTLAKCITGFIPHHVDGTYVGSIIINDHDMGDMSLADISRLVGLVQQDSESQICTLKVLDEIAFGPENFLVKRNDILSRIQESLDAIDSHHLIERETYALSGGEKKRIVIASILSSLPQYIVFDEPTSNLDPQGIKQFQDLLLQLKENNFGVLCIEHNLNAVLPVADRTLKLDDGKLVSYNPVYESTESNSPRIQPFLFQEPLLSASQISFSYDSKIAIDNLSLSIYPGEIIALMGDNGSGKTTLLRLLSGLLSPDFGQIFLGDTHIEKLSSKDIAKHTGIVFQNPVHQIFEKSVWQEYTLGLRILGLDDIYHLEQAEEKLKKYGLFEKKNDNPYSLSHGQKRRLNVLSSMVHTPSLLIFDEPFIGQDKVGRTLITESLLNHQKNGGASIVVTHDSEFSKGFGNRLVFLDSGAILLDGTPESVLSHLALLGKDEYDFSGVNQE
ncbi:MAG: putative HMP/thiamine import ATP-binding protein YkoD [Candidatus Thorarchaeota archaeon]|nr:MAG: putative HMP/thiamine import ATP-binding protein YkoD [Candidatus Thorarchaeota archaeon]